MNAARESLFQRRPRLQFNPGPLKVVARRDYATASELRASVQCVAVTRTGTRCARIQLQDSDHCWQHAERKDG